MIATLKHGMRKVEFFSKLLITSILLNIITICEPIYIAKITHFLMNHSLYFIVTADNC